MADKKEITVKEEKKQIVSDIADKLGKSKEVILVDYRGLSVKDMADLRSKLREAGTEFKVYKNTLARLAVKKAGQEKLGDFLEGPTAFAFDYQDEVTTPKILVDFSKDHKELEVKGGFLGGELLDVNQIKMLASLPSHEELLGKTVGALAGTIRNFLYVLKAPVQNFGSVIKQLSEG